MGWKCSLFMARKKGAFSGGLLQLFRFSRRVPAGRGVEDNYVFGALQEPASLAITNEIRPSGY